MGVKNWFSGLLGKQPVEPQTGDAAQAQAAHWQQQQQQQHQHWPPAGPLPPGHGPAPYPGAAQQHGPPGHPPQFAPLGYDQQGGATGAQPVFPPPQGIADPSSPADDFDRAAELVEREAQLPPALWRDDFGPLRADQAEEFFVHMLEIEQRAHDAGAQRQRARELGYHDFAHWHRTRVTFLKYAGEGDPNGPLSRWAFGGPRCMQLMMAASARMAQGHNQSAGPERELLSPVEGVTIDQYAEMAALAARSPSGPELQQLLARHGMDQARYERVSKAWIARMSTDTTATLATIYGRAFHGSGAGGAGQGGAGQQGGPNPPAAPPRPDGHGSASPMSAREPLPFEKFCELIGARAAWSKQGRDPDASMLAKLKVSVADFARVSEYWVQKARADQALGERQHKLAEVYEELYSDSDEDPDADLVFAEGRPLSPAAEHETLDRWRGFLNAVMMRLRDALEEAEASCREMVTAHATDPLPLGNGLGALGGRKQSLDKRIESAWAEQVSRALGQPPAGATHGSGEALGQAAFEMDQALAWMEDAWEHFRVRWSAEAARAMWPHVQASMQKPVSCRQCARPIEPSVRYQAESVRCEGCGSANQVDPESIVYTYFAMAPHALAEEQALEKRLAVIRHRRDSEAARKSEAARTGSRPDESGESLREWEALERQYWVAYAAAKAQVQPATDDEQRRLVESRMKQFTEQVDSNRARRTASR